MEEAEPRSQTSERAAARSACSAAAAAWPRSAAEEVEASLRRPACARRVGSAVCSRALAVVEAEAMAAWLRSPKHWAWTGREPAAQPERPRRRHRWETADRRRRSETAAPDHQDCRSSAPASQTESSTARLAPTTARAGEWAAAADRPLGAAAASCCRRHRRTATNLDSSAAHTAGKTAEAGPASP